MVRKMSLVSGHSFRICARGIDAVQQRHGDVQQNQVRFQTLSRLDERAAVFDGPHDFARIFDQPA
jgi:hypothetical protein